MSPFLDFTSPAIPMHAFLGADMLYNLNAIQLFSIPLMFHAKIQSNILSGSREVVFLIFAFFSKSGHLGRST